MRRPLKLRKLRATMVMKELSLRTVATRANVPYITASLLLSGRLTDPLRLQRLEKVIERAPLISEVPA